MNQELRTVLVVDDASSVRMPLRSVLSHLGFAIVEADCGEQALGMIRVMHLDGVLLDINMPGMNGIEVCRVIRSTNPRLPIIMLTVLDSEDHKVEALEAGADDYVTKPFRMQELIARLRSAIRRNEAATNKDATITIGEIEFDPAHHTIKKSGQALHLTPREFGLLHHLMSNAGRPIPHAELLKSVWGPKYADQLEYLRTFMRQLRKKIEDDPRNPRYLLTDVQVGYRFNDDYTVKPFS